MLSAASGHGWLGALAPAGSHRAAATPQAGWAGVHCTGLVCTGSACGRGAGVARERTERGGSGTAGTGCVCFGHCRGGAYRWWLAVMQCWDHMLTHLQRLSSSPLGSLQRAS